MERLANASTRDGCMVPSTAIKKDLVVSLRWSLLKENEILSFVVTVPFLCPSSCQGLLGVSAYS